MRVAEIERRRSGAPWFLWVHYYDPHLPYDAAGRATRRPPPAVPTTARSRSWTRRSVGCSASVDRSRTVVVVTADHGESLGEHGEPDHGFFLYDSTLHVPLIVSGPLGRERIAPRVVTEQVRSIDIAPTIAALAGSRRSPSSRRREPRAAARRADAPGGARSRSRRAGIRGCTSGGASCDRRAWASGSTSRRRSRSSTICGPIASSARTSSTTARPSPAGWPRRSAGCVDVLAAKIAAPPAQPDAATVERLQALGYVGTFAPVTAASGAENPLDRIADYRAYRDSFQRALTLLGRKRPAKPRRSCSGSSRRTSARSKRICIWGTPTPRSRKTRCRARRVRRRRAAEPGAGDAAFRSGEGAVGPGRTSGGGRALPRRPASRSRAPSTATTRSASCTRKPASGRRRRPRSRRPSRSTPRDPRAQANLAGAAMRPGDLDVAAAQFERMIELDYQVAPAQFNLGVIAARSGRHGPRPRAATGWRWRRIRTFEPARDALAKLKQRLRPASAEQRARASEGSAPRPEGRARGPGWGLGPECGVIARVAGVPRSLVVRARPQPPVACSRSGARPRATCRRGVQPNQLNVAADHARHDALGPHRRLRRRRRARRRTSIGWRARACCSSRRSRRRR